MEAKHFNTKLCDDCQNIFRGEKRMVKGGDYSDMEFYPHSAHSERSWVEGIHGSAQQGCGICQILRRSVAADANLGYQSQDEPNLEYFLKDTPWARPKHPDVLGTVVFVYEKILNPDSPAQNSSSLLPQEPDTTYVPISLVNERDVEPLLPKRILGDLGTGSKESWQCISEWINVCLDSHTRCNQERTSDWWPTRLLDIGDSRTGEELRLIVTSETQPLGPYVTLSHRWGAAHFIQLREDTLKVMKDCITIKNLPKTFRDTVAAAKRLGVRYIWIDSLCIIQGSAADWQAESSRMSDVYQNALCNISATGAADSEGGLFFDRDLSEMLPCRVELSWTGIERVKVFAVDSHMWERFFRDSLLISRAWVVQERILSPPVIHFGQRQLGWECQEKEHCEMYPRGFPPSIWTLGLKHLDPNYDFKGDLADDSRTSLGNIWCRIVAEYSKRDLTMECDKEAAISGIAARMSKLRNDDTLIAGLWRRDLLKELLWQRHLGSSLVRPSRYRAPSWSWLSVDGCVDTHQPYSDQIGESPWARIDVVQVNRTGHGPLAPIQNGRISLRGTLKKVRWSGGPNNSFCRVLFDGIEVKNCFSVCDDTYRAFENEEAWCLLLSTNRTKNESLDGPRKKGMAGHGIILSLHGKQDNREFTRAGAFGAYDKGSIALVAHLLESVASDSRTHRLWKELLYHHGLTSLLASEVCAKIEQLNDSELEDLYDFLSSIDFEDLPTQTITIW